MRISFDRGRYRRCTKRCHLGWPREERERKAEEAEISNDKGLRPGCTKSGLGSVGTKTSPCFRTNANQRKNQMNAKHVIQLPPDEFLTRAEAARALSLTTRTISKYIKAGTLRCSRLNHQIVRIRRSDLEDLMDRHASTSQ
jgi:excisionase family DNA binding protein